MTTLPLPLEDLTSRFPIEGRVLAIVLRPDRRLRAVSVPMAEAVPGRGLVGDRRALRTRSDDSARKREVTLIQSEHLALIGSWCGTTAIDPLRVRRNLVLAGLNVAAMRSPFPGVTLVWRIGGDVRIEVTGPCDPCSRMEEELGFGGYNAMRGHGGMTARIVTGGEIHVGDRVVLDPTLG